MTESEQMRARVLDIIRSVETPMFPDYVDCFLNLAAGAIKRIDLEQEQSPEELLAAAKSEWDV